MIIRGEQLILGRAGLLFIFGIIACFTFSTNLLHAQSINKKILIDYKNNLLTLIAKDVDLKNALLKISNKTNVYISIPKSLRKRITIQLNKIPLKAAFERILNGLNYLIIYHGPQRDKSRISKVILVYNSKKQKRLKAKSRSISKRIGIYERRIKSIKKRLSTVDENSRRGKSYLMQIKQLENNIKRFERQLYN
jgi:hypothetical protein